VYLHFLKTCICFSAATVNSVTRFAHYPFGGPEYSQLCRTIALTVWLA